ncbi:hypothetical protein BsWGS_11603 [Bradybaena similaris]
MGQSFSVEELQFVKAKQGQKVYPSQDILPDSGALDALLEEIDKRISRDRSAASRGLVFYTRHRTSWGAPTINRRSYNEDEIRRFEEENDGFPLAATQEEIRQFDEQLVAGKRRKLKKKSWSFSEVIAQRNIRFPVISRPKFVDRIITGYSSLTRRSPSRQKHNQRHLSLDHFNPHSSDLADVPAADCVAEEDNLLECDREITSISTVVKFCFKCDLPVLFEDINTCTVPTDNSLVICFACQEDNNGQTISEADDLSENGDDESHAAVIECSEWLPDDSLRLQELPTSIPSECENEEISEYYEPADEAQLNSQVVEYRSHILSLQSFALPDHIRQQCKALLPPEQSHNDSACRSRKLRRSKSDRSTFGITSFEDLQKQSLSLQSDDSNLWPKNYYSIVKGSTFSKAVMAKGYVRALAEQINQGTLKVLKDEENEVEDSSSEMSQSTSSVVCARNEEIQINLVHNLIKAAEQQKFKEDRSAIPSRKLNNPTNDETDLNNGTESDCTVLMNRHLVSECILKADSVHSLYNSADNTLSNEATDNIRLFRNPPCAQFIAPEGLKSPNSLPCSPLKPSPMGYAASSQSATQSLQSSYSKKSAAKYDSKPKVPPKPLLRGTTSPSSPDSVLSPQSPLRTTPHASLPETSPASSPSLSSHRPPVSETLAVQSPESPTKSSSRTRKITATRWRPPKIPVIPKSPSEHSPKSPSEHSQKSPSKHSPKSPTACSVASTSISPQPLVSSTKSTQNSTLSPLVSPLHSMKSSPMSPKSPIIPSLINAVASAFLTQPTSPASPHPPRPTSPPPRTPSSHNSLKKATTASNNHTDTVEKWLNETHSSSTSDTSNDDVSVRTDSKCSTEQYRNSVFQTIYDNQASQTAAELFDSSWSDSDSFDDMSDEDANGESTNGRKVCRSGHYDLEQNDTQINSQTEVHLKDKRFHIAQELLQTEKDYVAVLHLLHHVFYERLDNENGQQSFLPADALNHMFSNTKSIFLFHHDFLLPQLENRMKNWERDPRIGDLMKKNAPFLKMYTEYIRNFDRAMKLINQWMEKSTKFSEIIQDIQKQPECRNLSLQHHMLGPIQRVPRYELLLKDYVRHLPDDSPDMNDAKDALDLVTKAACHSNEAMKKIETFHKLLDIYQSLRGVAVDFISPAREFVTQGPVTKIAARSGEKQIRHLFLFNDLVLVCIQYNLLGTYSVRSQLELDGMEIKPGTSMHIPNSFLIRSKQKAVELLDESPSGEVFGWYEKIQTVISNYKMRKGSIKQEEPKEVLPFNNIAETLLGKTAPVWIQDDAASMCMVCMVSFNMVRRRHHCRACGKLICKTCCKKAPLEYIQGKIQLVCTVCYDVIVNKRGTTNSETSNGKQTPKKKGVLQVNPSTGLLSAYMNCSDDEGHSWQKFWVTAHNDFVLYTFRAHEDVSAVNCVPLPGHEVGQISDIAGRQHVFSLSHKKKIVWMFQPDNDKHLRRWITLLTKLSQAQLPDENVRLSSQSNSSNSSSVSDSGTNNGSIACINKRGSTHSGSQADSGYPGDSTNSLAVLAADDNDHDSADVIQGDGADGVFSE